jgi:hypothetical protein
MSKSKVSLTDRKIAAMLRENTGRHMLDSGGAYGRNWERNAARNFAAEPACTLKFSLFVKPEEIEGSALSSVGSIEATHNIYHFLSEALTYDVTMNRRFSNFVKKIDDDDSWTNIVLDFIDFLGKKETVTNVSGWVNTYNGEDMVSQVYQYLIFAFEGDEYAAVQIHGGCDVRGGYTDPVFFRTNEDRSLYDNARGMVSCDGRPVPEETGQLDLGLADVPTVSYDVRHYWETYDGGYSFKPAEGMSDSDNEAAMQELGSYPAAYFKIDAEGNGYCPHCGGALRLRYY